MFLCFRDHYGQGLLETTIAIGILSVGVLSIFGLGTSQLRAIHAAEERLIAGELAREGVEIVRSIRDSNWLAGTGTWTDGWAGDTTLYRIPALAPDDTSGNVRWSLHGLPSGDFAQTAATVYSDGLFYRQALAPDTGWTRTPFRRVITITPYPGDLVNARRVVVEVRWGASTTNSSKVVVEEVLWNWR